MILGSWGLKAPSARGNDKKSAVFDTKQAFSDKKMPFRDPEGAVRCSVLSSAVTPSLLEILQ
jgi:hypothetical protein